MYGGPILFSRWPTVRYIVVITNVCLRKSLLFQTDDVRWSHFVFSLAHRPLYAGPAKKIG